MARSSKIPHTLNIRTYQMGFGDCFLLTFEYDGRRRDRHVLIDFGSMKYPKGQPKLLERVARSIRDETGGKLDMIVATHRHQDHIRGFGLKSSGKIIADLDPGIVVQPWTEDPDIAEDATAPARTRRGQRRRLANMNAFAAGMFGTGNMANVSHLRDIDRKAYASLKFVGKDNIKNLAAVEKLIEMGKAGRRAYVHAGSKLRVKRELPGVEIDVLGPPTVEQYSEVRKQRHTHDSEYWHMQAVAGAPSGGGKIRDPFPDHPNAHVGRDIHWTRRNLRNIRLGMLKSIVRDLDHAMNNTSLILLFTVGGKSVLFPGDAQIENWEYTLNNQAMMDKLKGVDVYKVGHHGSLNATPKSLWENFANKGDETDADRMTSLLSTLKGKHGHAENNSEVPRKTLVSALKKESHVVDTEEFGEKLFVSTVVKLR